MIRKMDHGDLEQVSNLAIELGYKPGVGKLRERLALLKEKEDQAFFVAVDDNGGIVGWVHAHEHQTLLTDARIEIAAIVVAQTSRGKGFGKALIQEVESWAQTKSIFQLRLGSRVQRTEAHQFYQKLGFGIEKTWHVFTKEISCPAQ